MSKFLSCIAIIIIFSCLFIGCGSKKTSSATNVAVKTSQNNTKTVVKKYSQGYAIQVGAFKNVENASRLVDSLNEKGFDAFLFKENNIFKVRFGNYSSHDIAKSKGDALQRAGKIGNFFIVSPDTYSYTKKTTKGSGYVRDELVKTASRYIGVPYVWGGNTMAGVDCSGLTRAIYRLNGIDIPRISQDQYKNGKFIRKASLQKGDLVFFGTKTKGRVNHVGIYIGGNQFIHAPRKGKTVCKASLNDTYWKKVYLGGRSYL